MLFVFLVSEAGREGASYRQQVAVTVKGQETCTISREQVAAAVTLSGIHTGTGATKRSGMWLDMFYGTIIQMRELNQSLPKLSRLR
jgi:hypothetical protein